MNVAYGKCFYGKEKEKKLAEWKERKELERIIISEIVRLREMEKKSFETIAMGLNDRGLWPRSAKKWNAVLVFRIYKATGRWRKKADLMKEADSNIFFWRFYDKLSFKSIADTLNTQAYWPIHGANWSPQIVRRHYLRHMESLEKG
ncbi:MAG: hypothetical protein PHO27_12160 [Sulfuricurvum sp.]|jgi:hypothetical protein|nr:hypothetical protein [Sulfuricurvum sp.]